MLTIAGGNGWHLGAFYQLPSRTGGRGVSNVSPAGGRPFMPTVQRGFFRNKRLY